MDTSRRIYQRLQVSSWRQVVWLGLIVLLLTGCVTPFTPLPSYVVMLTPSYPSVNGRCTGAVIDATHVLTAYHCIDTAQRIITPWGQEAWIVSYSGWPGSDIAVVEVDRVLIVDHYAEFGRAALNTPAQVYGTCPYYWGHQARHAFYGGLFDSPSPNKKFDMTYDMWHMFAIYGDSNKACGGDSGGVVIQNGKLTGITSAIASERAFFPIGSTLFAIPSDTIRELLDDESVD